MIEAALRMGNSTVLIRSFAQARLHRVRPTAASCQCLRSLLTSARVLRWKMKKQELMRLHHWLIRVPGTTDAAEATDDAMASQACLPVLNNKELLGCCITKKRRQQSAMQWRPHSV